MRTVHTSVPLSEFDLVTVYLLGAKCSSCVLQQVGGAVKLMIVLMEGSSFPLDDYDGN